MRRCPRPAVIAFAWWSAIEPGPRGVRVNSISPGPTKTAIGLVVDFRPIDDAR